MTARTDSPWTLVREVGLDYAPSRAPGAAPAWLWPVAAARLDGGAYLVVDDVAADADPLRMTCRTHVVSPQGRTLFDSAAQGVDDAFGCAMDGERFALLGRARSELVVASLSGGVLQRVSLAAVSTHPPSVMAWTPRQTFVVAFLAGINHVDLAELDAAGNALWARRGLRDVIGIPASVQRLPDGALLVADEFHHVVWTLAPDGTPAIAWGRWHQASRAPGHLHRPKCAHASDDGRLLIADAHNHRVVCVERGGAERAIGVEDEQLAIPTSAVPLADGRLLLCDAGNACVTEVDGAGRIVHRLGTPSIRRRLFSFPRSVEHLGADRYLIADTGHNRVVAANGRGAPEAQAGDAAALFWPRAARRTLEGTLLIADGRHARVVEVSADGHVLRQLDAVRHAGRAIALRDPHDVRRLADGSLLVVDAEANLVIETGWDGEAAWVIGAEYGVDLRNPHSAQALPDGRILVADSQNDRVVVVDPQSGSTESLAPASGPRALRSPKYAEISADGTLLVVDTGNHRVLVTNDAHGVFRELVRVPGSPCHALRAPRWAQQIGPDDVVVSDHSNHRIVHLRWTGPD